MSWSVAVTFNLVGSMVIAVFGFLVLAVRPRTTRSVLVGLYGILFGAATGVFNLGSAWWGNGAWPAAVGWIASVGMFGLGAVVVAMWRFLPSRPPTRVGLALATVLVAIAAGATAPFLVAQDTYFANGGLGTRVYAVAVGTTTAAACGAALVLARGLADRDARGAGWRDDAVLASALMLWPGSMLRFSHSGDSDLQRLAWIMAGYAVLVAVAWLWAGGRSGRARTGRTVAWVALGAAFLGLLDSRPGAGYEAGIGTNGISRILAVALLSYAIVRHHVLGLDVKVRFTISKSAVAAVFVGVFFAASELAQQFFGDQTENEYYGVAAAGLLVVAIAPIQRLADRLAQRAIPLQAAAPVGNESAYMAGLRAAARDGRITRREERHLAEMAEHLKIGPRRALELRESVEAEARS